MRGVARRFRTSDFDYTYPCDAIAQRPLPDRSAARLLVLNRETGAVDHHRFREFALLPEPGDVVVLNASRVVPARLTGRRSNGAEAEILLVHEEGDGSWLAMVHPGGKLKAGRRVMFGSDASAEIVAVLGGGLRRIRLSGSTARQLMTQFGTTPLPPYIERAPDVADQDRYQTVFAREDGSVAAPTAGLHFTPSTLDELRERDVQLAEVILHIGPGTFKPVATDDPDRHRMHPEYYAVSADTAAIIERARHDRRRIWAVGTSVARVLETIGAAGGCDAGSGWTSLFIHPPFEFQVVDALLTNFHLPRSTLIMLVAAFAGHEPTMHAYREAVAAGYRLFSYGDAMVVV